MDALGKDAGRYGYTLAELIVVMTLLAVLSTAATPVFRKALAETREEHAVQALVDTMQSARGLAVAQAAEYRVYVYADSSAYELVKRVRDASKRFRLERHRDYTRCFGDTNRLLFSPAATMSPDRV